MSSSNFYCPICFEKFNKKCRQPISVSCGHTFCLYCIHQISQSAIESACVICRRQINTNPCQFSKNILVIELLEYSNQLGKDESCLISDCSICNPPTTPYNDLNEQEEISEQEMIDELSGDLEIFLQQRPETISFMLSGDKRGAERQLLDAFFELLDECAEERTKILDSSEIYSTRETDDEIRQVEAYARKFEALCTYMIITILRLRTLNSSTVYAINRVRGYFPLKQRLNFVELAFNEGGSLQSSINGKRLEKRLQRISSGNEIYRRAVGSDRHPEEETCDFIEYIPNLQVYHCLICNAIIHGSIASRDPIGQHIQDPSHKYLFQEVGRLPFGVLLRRSNAYRIQRNSSIHSIPGGMSDVDFEDNQSRPVSTEETRQPSFFS